MTIYQCLIRFGVKFQNCVAIGDFGCTIGSRSRSVGTRMYIKNRGHRTLLLPASTVKRVRYHGISRAQPQLPCSDAVGRCHMAHSGIPQEPQEQRPSYAIQRKLPWCVQRCGLPSPASTNQRCRATTAVSSKPWPRQPLRIVFLKPALVSAGGLVPHRATDAFQSSFVVFSTATGATKHWTFSSAKRDWHLE
jgi:hypothetical protein